MQTEELQAYTAHTRELQLEDALPANDGIP